MGIRSSQHHRQLLKCPDVCGGGGMGSWMGHGGYGVLDIKRGQSQHHRQLLKDPDVGSGGDPIWDMGDMGSWMGHGGYGVLDIKRGQSQYHRQLLEYPDVGKGDGGVRGPGWEYGEFSTTDSS